MEATLTGDDRWTDGFRRSLERTSAGPLFTCRSSGSAVALAGALALGHAYVGYGGKSAKLEFRKAGTSETCTYSTYSTDVR
ncbi:hypothetical protein ADK57_15215 [Streptomyces sp. MMG1533]|uniref:hypothetical protein n=1 Tax=Streptomyces sp. MMG1533 TaxID=1415546 RepID=UPI0006AE656A|nr:hypothetical protein [Streptomyces sp. MMG1533]KOU68944.1 hypothetical protein ADK57_15215 [Streptomyces sp. MMG1533]